MKKNKKSWWTNHYRNHSNAIGIYASTHLNNNCRRKVVTTSFGAKIFLHLFFDMMVYYSFHGRCAASRESILDLFITVVVFTLK